MPVLSGSNPLQTNFIQSLDVRTRILICCVYSIGIVFIQSWYPLMLLLAASFIYVAAHGRLKVLGIAYGGVLLMFGMAVCCIRVMALFLPGLGDMGAASVINPFARVLILVNVILALAVSCSIRNVMTSLKSFYLPFFIYLPATVMIRFIPGFINDVKQISESMKIKGYVLNLFFLTFHPLLAIRLLFVPVVIRALRSADELSVAAELKGINSDRKRTRVHISPPAQADFFVLLCALLLMGLGLIPQGAGI